MKKRIRTAGFLLVLAISIFSLASSATAFAMAIMAPEIHVKVSKAPEGATYVCLQQKMILEDGTEEYRDVQKTDISKTVSLCLTEEPAEGWVRTTVRLTLLDGEQNILAISDSFRTAFGLTIIYIT